MSMDEMLLQELYGSQEVQAEEEIKQAMIDYQDGKMGTLA